MHFKTGEEYGICIRGVAFTWKGGRDVAALFHAKDLFIDLLRKPLPASLHVLNRSSGGRIGDWMRHGMCRYIKVERRALNIVSRRHRGAVVFE